MEFRKLKQWLIWDLQKGNKIPFSIQGNKSSSTAHEDFVSFDEAKACHKGMGPAFCFTKTDGLIGIDLDDCFKENLVVKDWAIPIIDRFSQKTYCEISPSLEGMKIWTAGHKPSSSPCSVAVSDGAVEVYEHGRFFTYTDLIWGNQTEAADCQDEIDWLFETYFPQTEKKQVLKAEIVFAGDLMQRGRDYVEQVQYPPAGFGRNNVCFKTAGHLAAMGLDQSQVLELINHLSDLHQGDPRPGELATCVANAFFKGQARQEKNNFEISAPTVDFSKLQKIEAVKQELTASDLEFPKWKKPGLIFDIIKEINDRSFYKQPELAWAAALSLLSVITGRYLSGPYDLRTNVMMICLSRSATGKEASRSFLKRILMEAGCDDLIGFERIGSHQGMVNSLVRSPTHRSLFLVDEIGHTLKFIGGNQMSSISQVPQVLMHLYSSSNSLWKGDAYADETKIPIINQPHMVLLGSTTEEVFWQSITEHDMQDGFVGRLMFIIGRSRVSRNKNINKDRSFPTKLVEAIKFFADFRAGGNLDDANPDPLEIDFTSPAEDRINKHRDDIDERRWKEAAGTAAIWGRCSEKASKLAMLFAISRCEPNEDSLRTLTINIEDVELGIKFANAMTRNILYRFSTDAAKNWIDKAIKQATKYFETPGNQGITVRAAKKALGLYGQKFVQVISEIDGISLEKGSTEGDSKIYLQGK